jgi:hypothetical protein
MLVPVIAAMHPDMAHGSNVNCRTDFSDISTVYFHRTNLVVLGARVEITSTMGGKMAKETGKLAVVTGASAGIERELARCCAETGYDLFIAADDPAKYQSPWTS